MKNNTFEGERADFLDESEELLRQKHLLKALNLATERLNSFPVDADAHIVMCNALIGMGGLWAQGISDIEAAYAGVYLHGLSGDLAAKKMGERGILANDLIDYLPAAMQLI